MKRYLISFDDGTMTIPENDLPDVVRAAHAVVRQAQDAGVWVFGGGVESQRASIVATDGTVTDGPYPERKDSRRRVRNRSRVLTARGTGVGRQVCLGVPLCAGGTGDHARFGRVIDARRRPRAGPERRVLAITGERSRVGGTCG